MLDQLRYRKPIGDEMGHTIMPCSVSSYVVLNGYHPFFTLQLKMLRVGHDNSGSNSRWLLDEVVIFSLARGERYVFKGGRWIGGRTNEIDLPLGELKTNANFVFIRIFNGYKIVTKLLPVLRNFTKCCFFPMHLFNKEKN